VHADWIAPISGGGGSPAAEAVLLADELLADYRKCFPHTVIELTMLSDGRFQLLPEVPLHADALHVIDFEQGALRLQRAELLAQNWGARYSHINDILPGQIQQATSTTRHNQ
jgi:magnesium chelatase subunit ChlD-like protein